MSKGGLTKHGSSHRSSTAKCLARHATRRSMHPTIPLFTPLPTSKVRRHLQATHNTACPSTPAKHRAQGLFPLPLTADVLAPRPPGVDVVNKHPACPPRPVHCAVMWAGDVPHDASQAELWRFFAHSPDAGVCAIALIPRSGCAFVSYASVAHRHAAVARFHGRPLRGADARLVCRARREEDDLRAGVGSGTRTQSLSVSASASASSATDAPVRPGSAASSCSQVSSNSSLLRRHFPQRFFILKSLTREDLDRSVQTRLWAPQAHNAGILDRAFRTSEDVFLMFSVNKSGEFYGYARMAGRGDADLAHEPEEGWGANIKLQWLRTARLPFQRVRHIRNPWNHNREIKVSRDGTELEPGAGKALLEAWRPERAAQKRAGRDRAAFRL
ncbi:YT521-B-like domain-containing protein [Mycena polygramma]|nr:YT521-B-like domain-containing protein [Mycena polygramma]